MTQKSYKCLSSVSSVSSAERLSVKHWNNGSGSNTVRVSPFGSWRYANRNDDGLMGKKSLVLHRHQ